MNIFILFALFVSNFSFLYIYLQITKIYNEGEISKFKFLIYQIKPYRLFVCLLESISLTFYVYGFFFSVTVVIYSKQISVWKLYIAVIW